MAVTSIPVTIVSRTVFGNKRIVIADLTMGNDTWPTGGVSFTPAELNLQGIDFISFCNETGNSLATLLYGYDYSNKKVIVYTASGAPGATVLLIEAVNAVPNETVRVIAVGYGKG